MKRLPLAWPLSVVTSPEECPPIWAALEGNPQRLAARLRSGIASNMEQSVAADLIEKKIKPRRPRLGSDRESLILVAAFVYILEKAFADPTVLANMYMAAYARQPTNAQVRAMTKAVQKKWQKKYMRHIAAAIVGGKSKVISDRQVYNAVKAFTGYLFPNGGHQQR
jgi:ABC-type transporter MlaC component